MTDNYLKLLRYNTYEAQATVSNVKIAGVDQQALWLDLRASLSRNGSYPLCQCVLVLADLANITASASWRSRFGPRVAFEGLSRADAAVASNSRPVRQT